MTESGVDATSGVWGRLHAHAARLHSWILSHSLSIWIVLLGVLVRLSLAVYTAEGDTSTFSGAAASMAYGQPPYTYLIFYPPGWVFMLGLLGRAFAATFSPQAIVWVPPGLTALAAQNGAWYEPSFYPTIGFDLALKTLIFAFDVLIGILLYVMIQDRTQSVRSAQVALGLWMLNPLGITVSAIHGTYDSIPAFLTVLAFYLVTKREYLSSGVSLGLGTIMKVFPIVLFPLFILMVWDVTRGAPRACVKRVALLVAGFGAVLSLAFWPPGILGQWFTLFFTGTARGGQTFGGFNQWAFLSLPGTGQFSAFLTANGEKVILLEAVELSLAFGFIIWRTITTSRNSDHGSLAYWDGMLVLGVCLTYLVVPVGQPQYLVWILPWILFIALCHVSTMRLAWIPYSVITGGGVAFYFVGLTSPLFFFQPAVFNAHFISPESLHQSLAYWSPVSVRLRPFIEIPVAMMFVLSGLLAVRLSNSWSRTE